MRTWAVAICGVIIALLLGASAPATASTSIRRTVSTNPGVRPFASQSVRVSSRAVVTFTVPRKTPPEPPFPYLPKTAGGYFALYFPAIRQGWVNLPDPGSRHGWAVEFPLIGSAHFPSLLPHHRYKMLVAVQRHSRIPLPFPMHVLRVRRTRFRVSALTRPIKLLTRTSSVALGAARDSLTDLSVEATGIVLDWQADASLTESIQGDACPALLPVGSLICLHRNLATFIITQTGFGSGTPLQIVVGESFDHPVNASYISTYAGNLPTPFDAATIVAFGITPPRTRRTAVAPKGHESTVRGRLKR